MHVYRPARAESREALRQRVALTARLIALRALGEGVECERLVRELVRPRAAARRAVAGDSPRRPPRPPRVQADRGDEPLLAGCGVGYSSPRGRDPLRERSGWSPLPRPRRR